MSAVNIRKALEAALNAMTPTLATAWENVDFAPVVGTPYQQAFVQLWEPENPEFGGGYREIGIFQVNLRYPPNNGTQAATARAELIRSTFKRGYSFSSGDTTVIIQRTPEIGKGAIVDGLWFLPVRIRFYSNILN